MYCPCCLARQFLPRILQPSGASVGVSWRCSKHAMQLIYEDLLCTLHSIDRETDTLAKACSA